MKSAESAEFHDFKVQEKGKANFHFEVAMNKKYLVLQNRKNLCIRCREITHICKGRMTKADESFSILTASFYILLSGFGILENLGIFGKGDFFSCDRISHQKATSG